MNPLEKYFTRQQRATLDSLAAWSDGNLLAHARAALQGLMETGAVPYSTEPYISGKPLRLTVEPWTEPAFEVPYDWFIEHVNAFTIRHSGARGWEFRGDIPAESGPVRVHALVLAKAPDDVIDILTELGMITWTGPGPHPTARPSLTCGTGAP